MELSLKSISYNARLSEETNCYSADLYLGTAKVAVVSNRGHGGCDEQVWLDRDAAQTIEKHFAGLSKIKCSSIAGDDGEPFEYQPSLEDWCSAEVEIHTTVKQLSTKARKKTVIVKGGDVFTVNMDPSALDGTDATGKTGRERVQERNPGHHIINGLHRAELRKVLIEEGVCTEIKLI